MSRAPSSMHTGCAIWSRSSDVGEKQKNSGLGKETKRKGTDYECNAEVFPGWIVAISGRRLGG